MIFDYTHQPTDGVQIGRTEDADGRSWRGGVFIADRRLYEAGPIRSTQGVERIALANRTGDAGLVISGTDGKPRIRIGVDASNHAQIAILGPDGTVLRSMTDDR